jgi:hypothetical protein
MQGMEYIKFAPRSVAWSKTTNQSINQPTNHNNKQTNKQTNYKNWKFGSVMWKFSLTSETRFVI